MIAVEAAHEISARDVVTAKAVEVQLRGAVQVVRRLRPHLVEVDLHSGVEGFDRSPGVRGDVGVPEAVDVDEIELREPRRIGGGGSGASAVIEEERPYEFGGAGWPYRARCGRRRSDRDGWNNRARCGRRR